MGTLSNTWVCTLWLTIHPYGKYGKRTIAVSPALMAQIRLSSQRRKKYHWGVYHDIYQGGCLIGSVGGVVEVNTKKYMLLPLSMVANLASQCIQTVVLQE